MADLIPAKKGHPKAQKIPNKRKLHPQDPKRPQSHRAPQQLCYMRISVLATCNPRYYSFFIGEKVGTLLFIHK